MIGFGTRRANHPRWLWAALNARWASTRSTAVEPPPSEEPSLSATDSTSGKSRWHLLSTAQIWWDTGTGWTKTLNHNTDDKYVLWSLSKVWKEIFQICILCVYEYRWLVSGHQKWTWISSNIASAVCWAQMRTAGVCPTQVRSEVTWPLHSIQLIQYYLFTYVK